MDPALGAVRPDRELNAVPVRTAVGAQARLEHAEGRRHAVGVELLEARDGELPGDRNATVSRRSTAATPCSIGALRPGLAPCRRRLRRDRSAGLALVGRRRDAGPRGGRAIVGLAAAANGDGRDQASGRAPGLA